jgi:hypothetical protein
MERLVALWTPLLSDEGDQGQNARTFLVLLDELTAMCPFADPVRFGLVVLPLRGPSRFFGGEEIVLEHVRATAARVSSRVHLGVADGLFGAASAARSDVVVPAGQSDEFRRSLPIGALQRRELATVARRLGLHTVGSFADLASARVAERFGRDALHVHRVARGEEAELRGLRDLRLARRLAILRGDNESHEVQAGFFGDHLDADRRAAAVAHRVRQRLGPASVVTGSLRGGRTPAERATLVAWGAPGPASNESDEPWPGRIPAPSPATTFSHPIAVNLLDQAKKPVRVDPRGLLSAPVSEVLFERGLSRAVQWTAGPWPTLERWWSVRRRRAYLQVLTGHEALLVYAENSRWWLAGIYD